MVMPTTDKSDAASTTKPKGTVTQKGLNMQDAKHRAKSHQFSLWNSTLSVLITMSVLLWLLFKKCGSLSLCLL